MENYCAALGGPSPGGLGGNDGGMAEYLLVPATRYLIPLGDLIRVRWPRSPTQD